MIAMTTFAYAQGSIADICGQTAATATKCKAGDVGVIVKAFVYQLVVPLGIIFAILVLAVRILLAYKAAVSGDAGAYKKLKEEAGAVATGFLIIIVLVASGLYVLLKYGGVKEEFLTILKLFSMSFIPHAYAVDGQYLPNPLGIDSLYDFLLSIARLVIMFFIYPGLIAMWVWTGFSFVAAQGAPEALTKAKKYLLWAFVSTLVVFLLQAFLIAAQGTVNKILTGTEQQTSQTSQTNGTSDGRGVPAPGTPSAACGDQGGQIGNDGVCYPGRGAGSSNSPQYCLDKAISTLCIVTEGGVNKTGTCLVKSGKEKSCYVAAKGVECITTGGVYGAIDSKGSCDPGQRPKVGKGGSCRINEECGGALICKNGTCQ